MRRAVAAEDDLLLRVVQRVERVEELGLRAFLASEELDVIDEQHVDGAVALAEVEHAVVADGVDHLVHEPLGRDVGQLVVLVVVQALQLHITVKIRNLVVMQLLDTSQEK